MAGTWQTRQGIALSVGDRFMEKASPEEIAEAMSDQPDEERGVEISKAIMRVGLRMGLLAYGVQFLEDSGAPAEIVANYEKDYQEALAKATAKALGLDDWKSIQHSRTPEQQKMIEELAGRAATNRLRIYLQSNYMASIEVLLDGAAAALDMSIQEIQQRDGWRDDLSEAISILNRYFYVIHGDIDPAAKAALSGDQQDELSRMAAELVAYRKKHGGGFAESVAPCFHLETVEAARTTAYTYRQTEITQSEDLYFPTSLIWEKQPEIATLGPLGGAYDVSKRGSLEPIWVKATITGPDGGPLKIDGIRKGAQRAIGNLIDQARRDGSTELLVTPDGTYYLNPPISITAEQVYRRWAGLDTNATVTPQQAEEMEAAIDSLTSAPSEIDFQAQLSGYKKLEKQSDFDYSSPNAGKGTRENLITASKGWIYTRAGEKKLGYTIFTYPLFYFYSHIVGQIATIKRTNLTSGEEKPAYRDKSIHAAANNSREVSMRNAIAPRLARMKSDKQLTRKIRIAEVAEDIGIELTAKIERTLLKNLEQYLGELQGKGEIRGYSPVMGGRGGRKLMGYSVEF